MIKLYKNLAKNCALMGLLTMAISHNSVAQTMPVAQALPYTQDFTSFTGGAGVVYPAGWQGWQVGAATPTQTGRQNAPTLNRALVLSGTAASTAFGIYDFTGKIGILSNNLHDNAIVLSVNTTTVALPSKVKVSFDAMVIRNNYDSNVAGAILNSMVLQYRIGETGTFTQVSNTVRNTTTENQTSGTTGIGLKSLSFILPNECVGKAIVQIRWVLRAITASAATQDRPSFAIDNVSVTGEAPAVPATFTGYQVTNRNILIMNGTTYATNILSGVTRTQELSDYGGAKTDYVGNASGYFTTYKDANNTYYMVDPDGYKFYSLGVNTVVEQKGRDAVNTIKSIYANTIGNFSDVTYTTMPYCDRLNFGPAYTSLSTAVSALYDKGIFSVFDAAFVTSCNTKCTTYITAAKKIDKNLIGYFSDNEVLLSNPYSGPKLIELWLDVTNYGGQAAADANANYTAAVNWIKSRHGGVLVAPDATDKNEWPGQVADKYYSVCNTAIKAADPNHLYLGSRLHQDLANPYLFDAAGKYVDVLSVNNYNVWSVAEGKARYDVWEASGKKPFIVSEFYAQAQDSGLPNSSGAGFEVYTQQDRADFFEHYTMEVLKRKYNVGFQYFKMNDDDGLNNKGLLDTYYEFWEPMRISYTKIAQDVYRLRDFLVGTPNVLPIVLDNFTAKADGNRVKLAWTTALEINNQRFEIQRSIGAEFKTIYRVNGKGNSTISNNYLAYDDQPQTGTNYYKLLQFDHDNTLTEHGIRVVNFKLNAALAIKIFPNPSKDEVNIQFTNFVGNSADITLINMSGKAIHQESINTTPGESTYKLNLKSKLQPGQYILQVKGLGIAKNEKLIVL